MITYEVEDYSVSKLGELLNRHSHKGDGYSEAKSHLSYFDEYFTSVGNAPEPCPPPRRRRGD